MYRSSNDEKTAPQRQKLSCAKGGQVHDEIVFPYVNNFGGKVYGSTYCKDCGVIRGSGPINSTWESTNNIEKLKSIKIVPSSSALERGIKEILYDGPSRLYNKERLDLQKKYEKLTGSKLSSIQFNEGGVLNGK